MALAGLGAILAIVHVALRVPDRMKIWGEIKRVFTMLRIDLETFTYRMGVDREFDVDTFQEQFELYRKQYATAMDRLDNDILLTRRLRAKAQDQLNARVADKIVQE